MNDNTTAAAAAPRLELGNDTIQRLADAIRGSSPIGLSGNYAGDTCAKGPVECSPKQRPRDPDLMDLINGLRNGIYEAHETLSILRTKLEPVIIPAPPMPCGTNAVGTEVPCSAPAAGQVMELQDTVRILCRRLRETIEELQLP